MKEKQLRLAAAVQWTRLDWTKQKERCKDYLLLMSGYLDSYEPAHAYGTVGWDREYVELRQQAELLEKALIWFEIVREPVG
jgi:hypothetical protein